MDLGLVPAGLLPEVRDPLLEAEDEFVLASLCVPSLARDPGWWGRRAPPCWLRGSHGGDAAEAGTEEAGAAGLGGTGPAPARRRSPYAKAAAERGPVV